MDKSKKLTHELTASRGKIGHLERLESSHKPILKSLQTSEAHYRRLFETAQDGILILNAETGQIDDVNPFLMDMLGYSYSEFLGKKLWEIAPFKDSALNKNAFEQLQSKGYIRYEDLPLETKEGKCIDVEFVSNVYLVNDNKVIQCNIRDITDRRRAEDALSRERNRLKVLLNACQMADTQIEEMRSFVIEECVRLSESELGFFGFINGDQTVMTVHEWSKKAMEACAIDKKPVEFPCVNAGIWAEAIRQRKPVIVNDYKKPDPRKKGYPTGHVPISRLMSIPIVEIGKVVAVATVANKKEDYSEADYLHMNLFLESIWGIMQRQKAVDALRASEERFRTVADFTFNWETWRGTDGRYLYISPACKRTTGYSVEEFMDDPDLTIRIAHPDDREILLKHVKEDTSAQVYNFDFRIITRDDEVRWINHICQPVFSVDGRSLGRRASNRNITRRKELEIELEKNNQQLEALVKTRTAAWEELNTALKVLLKRREEDKLEFEEKILSNVNELIKPYLEKLKVGRLDATQTAYMNIVETNLNDIISPFLHRMSATHYKLTPQEIQIAALIKSGRSSKEVAAILNVAGRTINFHRENIRKKLGLSNSKTNLRSHLLSMK